MSCAELVEVTKNKLLTLNKSSTNFCIFSHPETIAQGQQ